MCFHFSQTKQVSVLETQFKAKKKSGVQITTSAHFNGFELPQCAVITNANPEYFQNYSWGLLPNEFSDLDIRRLTLNARIETLDEKKSFKHLMNQKCLIPATSFFEWQWLNSKGSNKQKYEISVAEQDVFAFGGLWNKQIFNNKLYETFSILTTEANVLMAKIHHTKKRMPVIIKPEDYDKFLIGKQLHDFAFPYQSDLIAKKVIEVGDNFSLF